MFRFEEKSAGYIQCVIHETGKPVGVYDKERRVFVFNYDSSNGIPIEWLALIYRCYNEQVLGKVYVSDSLTASPSLSDVAPKPKEDINQ